MTADPTDSAAVTLRRMRPVAIGLLVVICVVVAFITVSPAPPDLEGQRALREFLIAAHRHGLPKWITFDAVEFSSNVLMFAPIGFFGALALPRARWLVVPLAGVVSIAIEVLQAWRMPERVGTAQDVEANVLGTLIGYLMACVVIWAVRHWTLRRRSRVFPAVELEAGNAAPDNHPDITAALATKPLPAES